LAAVNRTNRRPGLILAFEERPAADDGPVPPRERRPDDGPDWEVHVWVCGCDGQPRCLACPGTRLKAELGKWLDDRRVIVSGQHGVMQYQKLGLLRAIPEFHQERGGDRPQAIPHLLNGNRLIAVDIVRSGEMARII